MCTDGRPRIRWIALLAASLVSVAAAQEGSDRDQDPKTERAESEIGRFDEARLRLANIPATIDLVDGQLMPSGWTLVNANRDHAALRSKEGPAWYHTLDLDTDASGIADTELSRPIYELLFRHERSGAAVLVRLHPMPMWAAAIDLHALVDERIASDSAELHIATGRTPSRVVLTAGERVAILGRQVTVGVDHAPSIAFEYDVQSARRLELGLKGPVRRVRTLLIRSPTPLGMAGQAWPALIEMTISAAARDFDAMARDFDDLVSRTKHRKKPTTSPPLKPLSDEIERCIERHRVDLARTLGVRLHPPTAGIELSYRTDDADWSSEGRVSAGFARCLAELFRDHVLARKAKAGYQVTMLYVRSRPEKTLDAPAYGPEIWNPASSTPQE